MQMVMNTSHASALIMRQRERTDQLATLTPDEQITSFRPLRWPNAACSFKCNYNATEQWELHSTFANIRMPSGRDR
jgi:hypothetical protein